MVLILVYGGGVGDNQPIAVKLAALAAARPKARRKNSVLPKRRGGPCQCCGRTSAGQWRCDNKKFRPVG